MILLPCSSIDIECLKGALLINENGADFYCGGVQLSIPDLEVWIVLLDVETKESVGSVLLSNIENWEVQLGNYKSL